MITNHSTILRIKNVITKNKIDFSGKSPRLIILHHLRVPDVESFTVVLVQAASAKTPKILLKPNFKNSLRSIVCVVVCE